MLNDLIQQYGHLGQIRASFAPRFAAPLVATPALAPMAATSAMALTPSAMAVTPITAPLPFGLRPPPSRRVLFQFPTQAFRSPPLSVVCPPNQVVDPMTGGCVPATAPPPVEPPPGCYYNHVRVVTNQIVFEGTVKCSDLDAAIACAQTMHADVPGMQFVSIDMGSGAPRWTGFLVQAQIDVLIGILQGTATCPPQMTSGANGDVGQFRASFAPRFSAPLVA